VRSFPCNDAAAFEWHGWAVVVASPGVEDDEEADIRSTNVLVAVQEYLNGQTPDVNEVLDWRWQNGQMHVWIGGCHNHPTTKPQDVLTRIGHLAPAATDCSTRSTTGSTKTGRAASCDKAPCRSRRRTPCRPTWAPSRTPNPAVAGTHAHDSSEVSLIAACGCVSIWLETPTPVGFARDDVGSGKGRLS
jgi:hypothetical protein